MKKNTFISLLSIVLLAVSCNSEDESLLKTDGRTALRVSGEIVTRATGTAWEPDDRIGIFMLESGRELALENIAEGACNSSYTYRGGFTLTTGSDTVWFPRDPQVKVDFIAYYPHRERFGYCRWRIDYCRFTGFNAPVPIRRHGRPVIDDNPSRTEKGIDLEAPYRKRV